jgi:hypothetical protein
MERARCEICEAHLPTRDEREHRQGRPRVYCDRKCRDLARWIRDARANAARTAARGFPAAVERTEAAVERKLAAARATA